MTPVKITEEKVKASVLKEEVTVDASTYKVDLTVQQRPVKAAITQTSVKVAPAERGPQGATGATGATGPQGPSGLGGNDTYTHDQSVPSDTWVIAHNQGRYPAVDVVDSAGTVQIGDINYDSANQVTVSFTVSFGGKAYLN